jgi:hypothetical protein
MTKKDPKECPVPTLRGRCACPSIGHRSPGEVRDVQYTFERAWSKGGNLSAAIKLTLQELPPEDEWTDQELCDRFVVNERRK